MHLFDMQESEEAQRDRRNLRQRVSRWRKKSRAKVEVQKAVPLQLGVRES